MYISNQISANSINVNHSKHAIKHSNSPAFGSSDNANKLNTALLGLALLSMASCSTDDDFTNIERYSTPQTQIVTDSINKVRSIDEYLTDLGFLQDGNTLGSVENMYFEDMKGTKHYLEKGDSTELLGHKSGVKFKGLDIDKDGNKEEYSLKFEKYHQGLIVTKEFDKNDSDDVKKDTVVYRFNAKADGTYYLNQAYGKGIILYVPIAEVRKTNNGLLFEGYDWVKEQKTNDIEILQNFQNNVILPKDED